MFSYIVKRILLMIPVLIGVSFLVFTLLHFAPGDPVKIILGDDSTIEAEEALREELGLNDPFFVQYGRYIKNIITKGDLGRSYTSNKTVTETLLERFPTTIKMASACVVLMILVGVPVGILSAIKQYSILDNVVVVLSLISISMPNFWFGLVLIMFFSVKLGWLPASGFYGIEYWILPAITVGLDSAAGLMRITRSSMLECIRQDYVDTARAKGQKEGKVITHHVLRNALIPMLTVIGNSFGSLLGGAIITEQIFSVPGIGKLMCDSINARDYPMVQGGVLLIAVSFSVVNLVVDILYAYVDPRIKSQYKSARGFLRNRKRRAAHV